jgi:hypothetical protein
MNPYAFLFQSSIDAIKDAQLLAMAERRRLLEFNKTNSVIVDGVIYRKGEYAALSKTEDKNTN